MGAAAVKRIVIVDDQPAFCSLWRSYFKETYGEEAAVETYVDALRALPRIDPSISLLMLDLEMPSLDGRKLLDLAVRKGVDPHRIVIVSGRDAEDLHRLFPRGSCLAVINKEEPAQQEAFRMIVASVMKRR